MSDRYILVRQERRFTTDVLDTLSESVWSFDEEQARAVAAALNELEEERKPKPRYEIKTADDGFYYAWDRARNAPPLVSFVVERLNEFEEGRL